MRASLLAATGAVAAIAWTRGLYASAVLAVLIAIWTGTLALVDAAPRPTTPPPPLVPGGDDQERRRMTAYLDLSPAPLVALDRDGTLRVVNRAARRLLNAETLVPNAPPALVDALRDTVPGRTATVELLGGTRSFALTTGDLSLAGGTTRIGALIDIDAELKAAEATALREFVQVLSHEIVNALTPMASLARTAADMLGDPAPAIPAIREAIETVARRADSLHRFGESYRALARLPAPVVRRVATAPFIADLAALFAGRWQGIALAVDMSHAPTDMQSDPDQLTTAIWAVLQNAAEALAGHAMPRIGLTVQTLPDALAIDIADNGPGVLADDRHDIFRPFFSTKAQGTGIGLALARQILRGHGGDLVLWDVDHGTCFRATLPAPDRVDVVR